VSGVHTLQEFEAAAGPDVIDHLCQLARSLKGKKVVHVNSTRVGGGVAEILNWLVALLQELGLEASWEVIGGNPHFYRVTKGFHNALQGQRVDLQPTDLEHYMEVNRQNAETLRDRVEDADFVFIHDPQPAGLLGLCPERKGKWVWRCHIELSRPYRPIWKFLRNLVSGYDASIFSLASFAQPLPHPQYLIMPSIDPLSEKNADLSSDEVAKTAEDFGIDPERPMILQVSRFDRFKDPVGVIQAYHLVKRHLPVQLVLAGGGADDDPEGAQVLEEVRQAAGDDPDIHVLLLPPDAHRTINALQRRAEIVLQKSIKEGFGLTVTEALWKHKPVIGGHTGGITMQVVDNHTGFLVRTPEGAAMRIRYLLNRGELRREMGEKARQFVRDNFLLTRHLREYMALMIGLQDGLQDRIELNGKVVS